MKLLIVHRNKNRNFLSLKKAFPQLSIKTAWKNKLKKQDFKDKDLIITIGGDGTFLSASHFIKNQLILGVNSNYKKSEGALLSITLNQLKTKLKKILNNKYKIKQYTREQISIFKKNHCTTTELALNEAFIGNINPHHPSNYQIKFKSKTENQKSSGIVIATGTGSTAWYKAIGGRKFRKTEKQLKFIIRELLNGRIHNSKIKSGKIKPNQKLEIISKMNHGLLAIDSIRTYHLSKQNKIQITIGKPLKVIQ